VPFFGPLSLLFLLTSFTMDILSRDSIFQSLFSFPLSSWLFLYLFIVNNSSSLMSFPLLLTEVTLPQKFRLSL